MGRRCVTLSQEVLAVTTLEEKEVTINIIGKDCIRTSVRCSPTWTTPTPTLPLANTREEQDRVRFLQSCFFFNNSLASPRINNSLDLRRHLLLHLLIIKTKVNHLLLNHQDSSKHLLPHLLLDINNINHHLSHLSFAPTAPVQDKMTVDNIWRT